MHAVGHGTALCSLQTWCRILELVPHSRLVLKNKPFICTETQRMWLKRFAIRGIATWRVDLLPLTAATSDHMEQYAMLDIALDPWPYAGQFPLHL
jgi:protein O-GlcNAc transferase